MDMNRVARILDTSFKLKARMKERGIRSAREMSVLRYRLSAWSIGRQERPSAHVVRRLRREEHGMTWTPERLMARADYIEKLLHLWHGKVDYAETMKMEVWALRTAAAIASAGNWQALMPILNFAATIPDRVDDATGLAFSPHKSPTATAVASITAGQFRALLGATAARGEG